MIPSCNGSMLLNFNLKRGNDMEPIGSKLTIFFEEPFWIGLYERISLGKYEVCKITFGSEPKDYQVYDFLLHHWGDLRFSPFVKADDVKDKRINPKRMQRDIRRQIQEKGMGTKAQQALKLQHEEAKSERKAKIRQQKDAQKERQYLLRQEKKKQKHRGR